MSKALDRLNASSAALHTSVDNAVATLATLPTSTDDSASLDGVSDSLDAATVKLDAAVAALKTVPAPPPPAE